MSKITGKEYPLNKIFCSDFEYHIPVYQRPYAWTEEETGTLFDDLFDFYSTRSSENYFLGSIVMIKDDGSIHADVIDGQQRLTTLSILFAAMAERFTGQRKISCMNRLQEPGDELAGIKAQPRLFLRDWDQPFFNEYVQNVRLEELFAIDPVTLDTDSKRHIQKNAKLLKKAVEDNFNSEDELLLFCQFLLNQCYLVGVSTDNQASAFRIFSVMNSRGLDLLPIDIIKSETIGKIVSAQQQKYTDIWEELENETGRDGFNEVFTHTKMIFSKERPKKNLLDEFREYVSSRLDPKVLIDDYLAPYSQAYIQLRNCEYTSTQNADEINQCLYWLNKTNNYDWMPPAIKFYSLYHNDSQYMLWFFQKLERLASYLLATGRDVNQRMDRYKWILVELENRKETDVHDPLVTIELTEWEKKAFIGALSGEVYLMPSMRRNYIIQRLDSFVSAGGASYNVKLFTIEHVLPQNPQEDGEWVQLWPDVNQRRYWLNRVANLVPLTRQRNSAAQNYAFAVKKEKYFQSKNGTSIYALTTQVLSQESWTPEVLEERQAYLLSVFKDRWALYAEEKEENQEWYLAGRGSNAKAYIFEGEKTRVLAGSVIAPSITEGLQSGYYDLRQKLFDTGVIVKDVFVKDYEFDSVSAAAAVILGRSANGRKEWLKLDGRNVSQVVP